MSGLAGASEHGGHRDFNDTILFEGSRALENGVSMSFRARLEKQTSERSGNTETDLFHAVDGCGPVAVRGAENSRTVGPGTAAKDTETTRCI